MEEQDKKDRIRRIIFIVLMIITIISIYTLYRIALPFMAEHGSLDAAVILAIVLSTFTLVFAVKGGVPPPKPKGITKDEPAFPTDPEDQEIGKPGVSSRQKLTTKAVKGGIPPAPRKIAP